MVRHRAASSRKRRADERFGLASDKIVGLLLPEHGDCRAAYTSAICILCEVQAVAVTPPLEAAPARL